MTSVPEPGPWVGEVLEWEPGRAITTRFLDRGRRSRGGESHPGGRRVSALEPELKGSSGRPLRRDGRDGRPGWLPARPLGTGAREPARCPGPSMGPVRGDRLARAPGRVRPRRAIPRAGGPASSQGRFRDAAGRGTSGLRGSRPVRRAASPNRLPAEPLRLSRPRPAGSPRSASMTSNGSSTARRCRL